MKKVLAAGIGCIHASFVCAFAESQNQLVPVGFLTYGTFNTQRYGGENSTWHYNFNDANLNNAVSQGKVAEIEIVIGNPNQSPGVGSALLEFALADIGSKKASQTSRYKKVLLFTNNSKSPRMGHLVQKYGFNQTVNYQYHDSNGNNITNNLVNVQKIADSPSVSRCHLFNFDNIAQAIERTSRITNSSKICPLKSNPQLKMWQLCK